MDTVKLINVLTVHWLFEVKCNHENKTDITVCACGWTSEVHNSVGEAIKGWATHVSQFI